MKNIFLLVRLSAALGILSAIVACSSTPSAINSAQVVPPERTYYRTQPQASAATVVFVKDEGIWASIGYHQLFINGKLAASLKTGERLQLQLDPGEHIFGILPTAFATTTEEFAGGYAVTSIDQSLKAGATYYYRILVDGDNTSRIQRFVPQVN